MSHEVPFIFAALADCSSVVTLRGCAANICDAFHPVHGAPAHQVSRAHSLVRAPLKHYYIDHHHAETMLLQYFVCIVFILMCYGMFGATQELN